MSPKKFRELFPVFLVRHDGNWDVQYMVVEKTLKETLHAFVVARISHVNSTTIPSIPTKNIVDIMAELAPEEGTEQVTEAVESLGFVRKYTEPGRALLRLGCTEEDFTKETSRLYLRYHGDCDELYFRDYLRENPVLANKYEALRQQLRR